MTHASVFSGIGGPEVAATMLGWENLFHCEINPFGRAVLDYWYPNSKSYEDITTTDFTEWRGRVNVLTGGFPCQPFSYAGKRGGATDDRYLWPYMFRCIDQVRPDWVVAENVTGILTMVEQGEVSEMANQATLFNEDNNLRRYQLRETFTLQRICTDLESHGYAVQPVLVPACAVGAPHRRDRVFIVARRLKDTDLSGRPIRRSGEGCEEHGDGRTAEHASSGRDEMPNDTPRTAENERGCLASDGGCTCDADRHQYAADTNGTGQPASDEPSGRTRQTMDGERIGKSFDGTERPCSTRHVADTDNSGLQEARAEQSAAATWGTHLRIGEWNQIDERSAEVAGCGRWNDFPSVSPVHRGNDGLPFDVGRLTLSFGKWRTEALKAYGNAIVPQVMYEIFRAIEQVENQTRQQRV